MQWLASISVRRPVFASVLILTLLVVGLIGYAGLGVEINRMSRSMMVEATLDAGSGLTPGMFVEARVTVATEPRPAIPASATIKRGQTWRVFVVVDGRLQERVVQLGPDPAPGKRSVLQGLVVGEFVATTITDQVVDGLRVQ